MGTANDGRPGLRFDMECPRQGRRLRPDPSQRLRGLLCSLPVTLEEAGRFSGILSIVGWPKLQGMAFLINDCPAAPCWSMVVLFLWGGGGTQWLTDVERLNSESGH